MRNLMAGLRRTLSGPRSTPAHPAANAGGTAGTETVHQPTSWRSRAVLPTVVVLCAGLTGVAIAGADADSPGLRFVQAGHWIYNSALGKAFHIGGGSTNIDAEVEIPGGEGPATVVQTDRNGYVLSREGIVEFGKSDLAVADPVASPADERPIGMEAADSAFAVYREAGKIVRFGEKPVTESAGGPIGAPLVTASGTLWVHRVDGGQLCRLPAKASRMTCTATTPAGHSGALTLVGERPMWVDTTADTMRPISADGLGRPARLGLDLPDSSLIAGNDLAGRIAAVDPDASAVHLVDAAAALAGEVTEPPISAPLDTGEASSESEDAEDAGDAGDADGSEQPAPRYSQVASDGKTLALLDERAGKVLTLDQNGERIGLASIPAGEDGEGQDGEGQDGQDGRDGDGDDQREQATDPDAVPVLSRGADSRLYVDSATGEHVMVVGDGGDIETVPADGVDPDRTDETASPTRTPTNTPTPTRTPKPPERTEPTPDRQQERRTNEPPPPPPPPAPSRPGAPSDVSGTAGNGRITVNWDAAPDNGSPITAYVLSWSGGSTQVEGSARAATITGLRNGTGYTITVSAVNEAGQGPGVSTGQLYPGGRAQAPRNFDVSMPSATTHRFSWQRPSLEGGELVEYRVSQGQDTRTTTGTSMNWDGLADGQEYRFTVRAITRSRAGEELIGAPAEMTFTADLGPRIIAKKGPSTDYNDDCQADNGCAFTEFEAFDLEPNTEYTFRAYASEWGEYNSVTLTTDENGYQHEDERFAIDPAGQEVWVVAEGPGGPITSEKFVWPEN